MRRRRPGRGDGRRAALLEPGARAIESAELAIRVQARASRSEIAGERAGRILVRVTAPPVGGTANDAICRLIAKRAGVARGRVAVIRGERSRDKLVRVDGLSDAALRARLRA